MRKKLINFMVLFFIFSCSETNKKINILIDDSEKISEFIEAQVKEFESKNIGVKFSITKFNGEKDFEYKIKNNADILIANSSLTNSLLNLTILKAFNESIFNETELDAKILETVDNKISVPFVVAKKLILYLNRDLVDAESLYTLSDINSICETFNKTCFDVYPDFSFGSLVFANNNSKDETLSFFNKNISRGLVTGVISFNDARTRFLSSEVALIFDYDVNYKIYKDKLNDKLSIFKLPINKTNNSYIVSNNETISASIFGKTNKDEKFLKNFIQSFLDPELQKTLLNSYYRLPVLKELLNENNLNNELLIVSYRQFELSKIISEKEDIDINSIFTDK